MKVELKNIDPTRFHVNERNLDGRDVLLIVPHKAMWDWERDELHMRSLLTTPEGEIISSGFPKFFNYTEHAWNDAIVDAGLRDGLVQFTEKMDGSLIIRTVIDGKVNLRTRGCERVASDMYDAVHKLVQDKYPNVMDPNIGIPQTSALFEYIAPENQIVVKYDEPRLIFLGETNWSTGKLNFWPYLGMQQEFSTPNVALVDLPKSIEEIRSLVSQYDDSEGVVAWTFDVDGAHLCKFKSAWYLRLHALRSMATPRYMKEYCYGTHIDSLEELKDSLKKEGFDWEILSYMEPIFNDVAAHRSHVKSRLHVLREALHDEGVLLMPTRKDQALKCKEMSNHYGQDLFGYMMAYVTGDEKKANAIAEALEWDMGTAEFKSFAENAKRGATVVSKAAMRGALEG